MNGISSREDVKYGQLLDIPSVALSGNVIGWPCGSTPQYVIFNMVTSGCEGSILAKLVFCILPTPFSREDKDRAVIYGVCRDITVRGGSGAYNVRIIKQGGCWKEVKLLDIPPCAWKGNVIGWPCGSIPQYVILSW